jgi:hypothetical protein
MEQTEHNLIHEDGDDVDNNNDDDVDDDFVMFYKIYVKIYQTCRAVHFNNFFNRHVLSATPYVW